MSDPISLCVANPSPYSIQISYYNRDVRRTITSRPRTESTDECWASNIHFVMMDTTQTVQNSFTLTQERVNQLISGEFLVIRIGPLENLHGPTHNLKASYEDGTLRVEVLSFSE